MLKLIFIGVLFFFPFAKKSFANIYTEAEARRAWKELRQQSVTDKNFRKACDFIQDLGQTNIKLAYEILAEYLPIIKATGEKKWIHIVLMNWARAKESLYSFEDADQLYREARENANGNSRLYNESLIATILLYLEWGRTDSLEKYLPIGRKACYESGDHENLSFFYTFRAMSYLEDTAAMRQNLDSAIVLATDLPNKNALFTALYNRAVQYNQFNLQQQVTQLDILQELAKDSSLSIKPRFYERTAFYFRAAALSIYYQLMQIDMLLRDYDNAWEFAQLFYNTRIKTNPNDPQAPHFKAILALVKAHQGEVYLSKKYLDQSRALFHLPEYQIPHPAYYLAAGMLAEQEQQNTRALSYYKKAYQLAPTTHGLLVMPPSIYYAHGLILNNKLKEAALVLSELKEISKTRKYSAYGYYYYQYEAELLKALGDYPRYVQSISTFYLIKDSLANINHYRVIQEIEARVRLKDKVQQISYLNAENAARQKAIHQQQLYFISFAGLSVLVILLLFGYGRNQYLRKRQAEQIGLQNEKLQKNKLIQLEKKHQIEIMQGAIDAQENERHKIADQLHDEVGSLLTLASLTISSTLEKKELDIYAQQRLQKAGEIVNSLSVSIRDISHKLTPLVIEKYGFKHAIEDIAHTINLSDKLKLETIIVGFEDNQKYPVSFFINLYRIIQELVHNIVKHAHAKQAILELVEHKQHISVIVEDDGVGIEKTTALKGKGLDAIQSRIAYLKGTIEITNKKDHGTLITIEVPV